MRLRIGVQTLMVTMMAWTSLASAEPAASNALAIAATAAPQSPPGSPSATPDDTQSGLQEIIVTARKRAEPAQSTPIAISALTAEDMQAYAIKNLSQIQELTPSLTFVQSNYGAMGAYVGIRGQRTNDEETSQDPAVAIYIDGIYQGGTVGNQLQGLVDVERVEVLKGPQGTLFGRNTTGGAISITSRAPTYDFGGEVMAGLGNFDHRLLRGVINLPLVADVAAVRIAAGYNAHTGYSHDDTNNKDLQDLSEKFVRATLRLDPLPRLNLLIRFDDAEGRSGGNSYVPIAMLPGSSAALEVAAEKVGGVANLFTARGALTPQGALALAGAPLAFTSARPGFYDQASSRNSDLPEGQYEVLHGFGESITATYDITDFLTAKYIGSWRHQLNDKASDGDGTPLNIFSYEDPIAISQNTQEFQINGDNFDHRLRWVAGAYYYYMTADDDANAYVLNSLAGIFEALRAKNHDNSLSGYTQATYALTSSINLTAGLRYTDETRGVSPSSYETVFGGAPICLVPTDNLVDGKCRADFEFHYNNVSYTASVDWSPAKGLMLYAKTSRGFRGGSPNQRGTFIPDSYAPFAPEVVTDYEAGLKSEWMNRHLRINLDYYHSNYDDIQRVVTVASSSGYFTRVQNAAHGAIDGVEFELRALPIDKLTLGATAAFTDARYLSYVDPVLGDLSKLPFLGQPRWTASASALYQQPTFFGSMSGEIDYYFQSRTYFDQSFTLQQAGLPNSASQGAYGLLNARIAATWAPHALEAALWMKNLTGRQYYGGINDDSASIGYVLGIPAPPRTVGVELEKKF